MLSVLSTLPLGYLELLGNLPPQLQAFLSTLKPPIDISTVSAVVSVYRRVFRFSDVNSVGVGACLVQEQSTGWSA